MNEKIFHLTAKTLCAHIASGALNAEAVCAEYLKRIAAYDGKIGAFLMVFGDQALERARAIDKKRKAGKPLGRLAGIPIAIKDNIHIKGELTSCASHILQGYRAPFSTTVVRLLEQEDAIFIGKTNLDEFAMGSSCEYSAFKKTYNPWNLRCSPGGSSGGSGAAVAARLCPIALGSDTGGSIRLPAAFCGVNGFKSTYGRVSRYGLVAFGSSLDQIGPFAASVEDIALIMEVMGKFCPNDSTSAAAESEEFLPHLSKDLRGVKVGVPRHLLEELPEEAKKNLQVSLDMLMSLGAECIDIRLDTVKYAIAVYYILATAEASTNLARFDGIRYGLRAKEVKTLDEVYEMSKAQGFGTEVKRRILLGTYVLSAGYQDAYYKKAQRVRALMIEEYAKIFKQCHVIAMPISPTPAFELGSIQSGLAMYLMDIFTIPANLAGLPAISVPSGFNKEGKPLALQLMGPQMHDQMVCKVAYAFESACNCAKKIPEWVNS